jgi:hypothetical protein
MTRKTNRITLHLPPEFIALCDTDGVDPRTVLRGFIADLCRLGIEHDTPARFDGYSSNGADAQLMALTYYVHVGYPSWRTGPKR